MIKNHVFCSKDCICIWLIDNSLWKNVRITGTTTWCSQWIINTFRQRLVDCIKIFPSNKQRTWILPQNPHAFIKSMVSGIRASLPRPSWLHQNNTVPKRKHVTSVQKLTGALIFLPFHTFTCHGINHRKISQLTIKQGRFINPMHLSCNGDGISNHFNISPKFAIYFESDFADLVGSWVAVTWNVPKWSQWWEWEKMKGMG